MHGLLARAGEASASTSAAPTSAKPEESASSKSNAKSDDTATDKQPASTTTDLNTAEPTESGKTSGTRTKGGKPTHTGFAIDAPPGGVNMLTPAPNVEPTPLYKMRDHVTWGWNYTSLLGTPTAIDVMVSCSTASETWTLTNNMSFTTMVNYVWDTSVEADSVEKPLLNAMYTLIVKDSDADMTAPPEPGYLGTYKGFTFGLYSPKPYTPYPDWTCTGCSDASSLLDRQALGLAVVMSIVTFLSFTWFVAGLGLH
ncbi:hypothetical protein CDD83_4724 [Cordyceps sp. RAO-2017]|nr:hypothetical protein CDD83_4724 [Cordyceps sp. RAO-2017]